jgi:hypothetical protein
MAGAARRLWNWAVVPEAISDITVLATYAAGRPIFDAAKEGAARFGW